MPPVAFIFSQALYPPVKKVNILITYLAGW